MNFSSLSLHVYSNATNNPNDRTSTRLYSILKPQSYLLELQKVAHRCVFLNGRKISCCCINYFWTYLDASISTSWAWHLLTQHTYASLQQHWHQCQSDLSLSYETYHHRLLFHSWQVQGYSNIFVPYTQIKLGAWICITKNIAF